MQAHASSNTDPAAWLDALARRDPDRVFLQTPDGQRVTYVAMNHRVDGIAAALTQRAVTAGDRVVAQIEKSADAIALYLACLRVGAVFVPLNTAYTSAEIEYFLGDADPKVAVGVERGGVTLTELARDLSGPARTPPDMQQPDLAALLYTSGTTGRSKGAMLTRANLATNAITSHKSGVHRARRTVARCRSSTYTDCSSRSTQCLRQAAPCCFCRSSTPTK
jgi:malonyl-CoA/methylmalonyl-CoA synthetase